MISTEYLSLLYLSNDLIKYRNRQIRNSTHELILPDQILKIDDINCISVFTTSICLYLLHSQNEKVDKITM